ncbi:MAG: nicotinate-nucleotide--dimethylbenzimidazole phosphoribosyltransferase [Lachnospiraceae bacterium]|nr:nicotinate-nucleotide--dimethylbenzimidazole phosphoribosyltransferase [Lachnospiraceae bacterium]
MMGRDDVETAIKARFDALAKPIDGFGSFEDMICRIGAVLGTPEPDISKKALVIMIADNGVTARGISQTDRSVTAKVAALMAKDKSSVGLMTQGTDISLMPVDIGIDSDHPVPGLIDMKVMRGTRDIVNERAMSEDECRRAIRAGEEIARRCLDDGIRIVATGEMGIGNTTTSAALFCALTGASPSDVAGRGAGLSDVGLARKIGVIETALERHLSGLMRDGIPASGFPVTGPENAFLALSSLGGLDIAGLVGVFKGCSDCRIPVVIDGAISAVAALAASLIYPGCEKAMLASHSGREKITGMVHGILGITPVINADLSLGEGTGAVMLFPLLDMVLRVYNGLESFGDAGIIPYERFDK